MCFLENDLIQGKNLQPSLGNSLVDGFSNWMMNLMDPLIYLYVLLKTELRNMRNMNPICSFPMFLENYVKI